MRKSTKIWMIVAGSLVIAGLILFTVTLALNQWNFNNFATQKYQTVTHELKEEFSNIKILSDTADITFLPSSDNKRKVVCYQPETVPFEIMVTNTLLTIDETNNREWYNYIGVNWNQPTITVYLPAGDYGFLTVTEHTGDIRIPKDFSFTSLDISASTGDVTCYASTVGETKIHLSTGHIVLENAKAGSLDLKVATGSTTLKNVECEGDVALKATTGDTMVTNLSCKNFSSNGTTGDIVFTNTLATEAFFVERSTGDVTLNRCDAQELFITTSTGEITGTLLSSKVFITETDTGSVEVPKSVTGGKCEITTDTGDIIFSIVE